MLEEYILIGDGGDGKDYVDVDCVREALGIKEDENIFRAIEKLKEDNDLLEELHVNHVNHISQLNDYAELYKTVLGKEKLDRDLSPHEVMKAILDEYKKVRDSARLETRCEVNDHIDELCDKYNVVQPEHSKTTRYKYLQEFRDSIYKELGIPRYGYTLTEAIDELKKRLDRYARFRSRIGTALCLGGETSDEDILNAVEAVMERATELQFNTVDKDEYDKLSDCRDRLYEDYTELRKAIWEAMDRKPETLPEENARLVREVTELARGEKLLIEFRDDIAKAIGMDYPTTNQVILRNIQYIYKDRGDAYDIVAKLNNQVKELSKTKEDLQQKFDASQKQVKGFTNRCDSLEDLRRDLWELRRNAIEDLKTRGFCFRPAENETLPEIYDKLLKRYDWAYGMYKEQYRLRQQWHVRYESEHERANGVQKALDREREKCRVKDISLDTAKKQYEKVCGNLETIECAFNGMKSKVRELREEKTKVIAAIGQDIWDDCVK